MCRTSVLIAYPKSRSRTTGITAIIASVSRSRRSCSSSFQAMTSGRRLHASARTMATNASSTVARVSRAVRTAMPRAPRTLAGERHGIGAAAHGEAQDVPVVRDLLDARRLAQGRGGFGGALDLELGDAQRRGAATISLRRARRRAARRGR